MMHKLFRDFSAQNFIREKNKQNVNTQIIRILLNNNNQNTPTNW